MVAAAKYTEQMPFVGTATQRAKIAEEAGSNASMAAVIRKAIDARYGLVDGEEVGPQE